MNTATTCSFRACEFCQTRCGCGIVMVFVQRPDPRQLFEWCSLSPRNRFLIFALHRSE